MDTTLQAISIWQPTMVEGTVVFVRPPLLPFGDHYADRISIPKNKAPHVKRVCFFGESAAAGYLYAPHVTPAKVLENHLQHICGAVEFEVIDLSMTNETLVGLADKVQSSLQLEPDLLVIFTGNNWTMLETPALSPYFPSVPARQEFACLLRTEGVEGAMNQAALEVLYKAAATFAAIHEAACTADIPVIVLIPEINLADWENRQAPLWLPGDKTGQWYARYDQTLLHLQNKEWELAATLCWEMEEIDLCSCPTTYRLMAKAYRGMGDLRKAQLALQAEVDSNRYSTLCFLGAPQINSGGRALQRKMARQYGFSAIDLREVFAQHTGETLPGRRMFLDYCHLTLEGMQVAMAAVLEQVLNLFGHPKKGIPRTQLLEYLPYPAIAHEADAMAKFGAAIHTAHRHLAAGEPTSIVEYWCREALLASPEIRHTLQDFVQARMAQVPAVLTAAQQRNYVSSYKLTMQHGWNYDYLDAAVIKALEAVAGINLKELLKNKGLHSGPIDLINPPYALWSPVERFYPEVMGANALADRAFFKAAWPESSFAVAVCSAGFLQVEITLRLPAIPSWKGKRAGVVKVKFNGQEIGRIQVSEKWTTARFSIASDDLPLSIYPVTICWPSLPACGDAAMADAVSRLEQGLEADLHPVFGEVFSLKCG